MSSYYNRAEHRTCFWKIVLNQRIYYIVSLVLNALILSFYATMAFTPHVPCLTPTGANITKGFEFAFKLGFFAIAADFTNQSFLEFYIRQRNFHDQQKTGFVSAATLTLETVHSVMEWVFRGLILSVSLFQTIIRLSATARYCINEVDTLKEEGKWLEWLIIAQIAKVLVLSFWHILLNKRKLGYYSNQFDATFFDQTTMQTSLDLTKSTAYQGHLNGTNISNNRPGKLQLRR